MITNDSGTELGHGSDSDSGLYMYISTIMVKKNYTVFLFNKHSSIKLTVVFNTAYESVFNNVDRSPLDKEREFQFE